MKRYNKRYHLIETEAQLRGFNEKHTHSPYIAFDTEFIPEKYYRYKLCIISVATPRGNFIIDVLKVKDISPFMKLVNDPAILKITHAGENDYQLLVGDYGAKPVNVFDTQLSYGFLQYDYPIGLQQLLQRELNVKLDKGQLKSDWEKRPLTQEQCQYAVEDVVYLHPLMESLKRRLKRRNKLHWAEEENRRMQDLGIYESDPLDFLNGAQVNQLSQKQQVFLLRMHLWRHLEAEKENRPVTQVLKTRVLNTIVQKFTLGKSSLMKDRTLPGRFLNDNWETFEQLFKGRIVKHEKELLDQIPTVTNSTVRSGILTDMLHQLIRYKGHKLKVSPKIIVTGKELTRIKNERDYFPPRFLEGWRRELLGEDLIRLMKNRGEFDITIKDYKFVLKMAHAPGRFSFFKKLFKKG